METPKLTVVITNEKPAPESNRNSPAHLTVAYHSEMVLKEVGEYLRNCRHKASDLGCEFQPKTGVNDLTRAVQTFFERNTSLEINAPRNRPFVTLSREAIDRLNVALAKIGEKPVVHGRIQIDTSGRGR